MIKRKEIRHLGQESGKYPEYGPVQKEEKLGKLEKKDVERHKRIRLLLCHFTIAGRIFVGP